MEFVVSYAIIAVILVVGRLVLHSSLVMHCVVLLFIFIQCMLLRSISLLFPTSHDMT